MNKCTYQVKIHKFRILLCCPQRKIFLSGWRFPFFLPNFWTTSLLDRFNAIVFGERGYMSVSSCTHFEKNAYSDWLKHFRKLRSTMTCVKFMQNSRWSLHISLRTWVMIPWSTSVVILQLSLVALLSLSSVFLSTAVTAELTSWNDQPRVKVMITGFGDFRPGSG
jgi:hypothetical protein